MYLSIRHKITAALFVCIIFLTLGITLFQQVLTYQQFKEHLREEVEATIQLAISQANDWFSNRMTAANLLGLGTEQVLNTSQDVQKEFVSITKNLKLETAYLAMDDGTLVTTREALGFKIVRFKKSEWYQTAKNFRKTFFIGPYLDEKAEEYLFSFGSPIFDPNRLYVKGAVCFDVKLSDLQSVLGSIVMNRVKCLELVAMRDKGVAIFVRQENMPDADFDILSSILKKGLPKSNTVLVVSKSQYVILYDQIPGTRLLVYYPVSLSRLFEPILMRTLFLVVISLLGFFLIFQFANFFIGRYVKRIEDLNEQSKSIAGGNFKTRVKKAANDEIGDLAASFNQMAQSLAVHVEAVRESTRYKERINRELELAKELQQKALPSTVPVVPGIEIAAISRPAQEVGGDYYDFLYPDQDKTGFVVADAAGKGFPGTIFMTNSRSVFRVISTNEKSPNILLRKMNDFLVGEASESGMFITLLYCVYEAKLRKITYANGGHYAPILFRPQEKKFIPLNTAGMPLGIAKDQLYEAETVQLEKGDVLVLYTDGVIESMNDKKEMFGLEKLRTLIEKNVVLTALDLTKKIEMELRKFANQTAQFDDITLMVLRVK